MPTVTSLAGQVVQQMKSSVKKPKAGAFGESVYDRSWEQKSFRIKATMEEIASRMNVTITTKSMGYINIIQDPLDGVRAYKIMYDNGLNLKWGSSISNDKAATYAALHAAGVPTVPHILFRYNTDESLEESFGHLQELREANGKAMIMKANTGGGGSSVHLCNSDVEVETALLSLRNPCMSPMQEVVKEYRVVQYGGEPVLVYLKERPNATGDGSSTVTQLVEQYIHEQTLWKGPSGEYFKKKWGLGNLSRVPADGEKVLFTWKHNLDFGCKAIEVAEEKVPEIVIDLARQAANIVQVNGAIDVVAVKEPHGVVHKVLEVNSRPGFQHVSTHIPSTMPRVVEAQMRISLALSKLVQ